MVAGYQAAAPENEHLSSFDLLVYMLQDEIADYVAANGENDKFFTTFHGKRTKLIKNSKCSVLIKLAGKRLFVSHDTWYDYSKKERKREEEKKI